jgi:pimeloyl-ACP methyl ester carboxylesterase
MREKLTALFDRLRPHPYVRQPALILLNGLAEQAETWFHNHRFWRRFFDVHAPNLLVYDGPALHQRIAKDLPISVDYLVEQLHLYLESFVQTPPYHLVASSLGGKIAVEYAVRYPEQVGRIVLLCPSGMGDEEQLPVVEGVRRNDLRALIDSVFFDRRYVEPDLVKYYQKQFTNRRWRLGLMRTIRGTMDHAVRDRLAQVTQPTLLIAGREDKIVSPVQAEVAARELPQGQFVLLPQCGHAPHMEKAGVVNKLVVRFLTDSKPLQLALPYSTLSQP